MTVELPNVGKIDRKKLVDAARMMGISRAELERALEDHRLKDLVFSSGQFQRRSSGLTG